MCVWTGLLVASLGNTLGACVNWGLGRFASRLRDRSWFPVNAAQLQRAEKWYARWGISTRNAAPDCWKHLGLPL